MRFIDSFKVWEINTSGTYLSKDRFTAVYTGDEISRAKKLYGKIFAEAPITSDKDWGIEFELTKEEPSSAPNPRKFFRVRFTDKFFKNFIRKDADNNWWKKFLSIFGIGGMSFRPLNETQIYCELNNYNRIHFPYGIPRQFRGIKLGYVIYEAFIKHLGYASSNLSATGEAQQVWSEIAEDPDFYCIVSSKAILAVHKDCKLDLNDQIWKWMWLQESKSSFGEHFEIDNNLLIKYPDLREKSEQIKTFRSKSR